MTRKPSTLPVAEIHPAASNVHAIESAKDESLRGLAESVKTLGMVTPIVVRPNPDGGYIVVDGHRRLAAAKLAKLAKVPVQIIEPETEAEAAKITLAANIQRLDSNPLLEAAAIERLLKNGLSRPQIAAALGKSQAWVARRARLTNLAEPWRFFAARAKCTLECLENIAAHEKSLQEAIANDIDLDEYDDSGTYDWDYFEDYFKDAMRSLSEAIFDTADCASCPDNTACQRFLFDWMSEKDASCQNAECYARRHEEAIDKEIEALRKRGIVVHEVANIYRVPDYWNASQKENKRDNTPWLFRASNGGLRQIVWTKPPEKAPAAPARTREEIAAEKERKLREKRVSSARNKIRDLLVRDPKLDVRMIFVSTPEGARAFERIAARHLVREMDCWISDHLCDEVFAEFAELPALRAALDPDEIEAYAETLALAKAVNEGE